MNYFLERFDHHVYDSSPETEAWSRAQQSQVKGEAANLAVRPENTLQFYLRVTKCAIQAVFDLAATNAPPSV